MAFALRFVAAFAIGLLALAAFGFGVESFAFSPIAFFDRGTLRFAATILLLRLLLLFESHRVEVGCLHRGKRILRTNARRIVRIDIDEFTLAIAGDVTPLATSHASHIAQLDTERFVFRFECPDVVADNRRIFELREVGLDSFRVAHLLLHFAFLLASLGSGRGILILELLHSLQFVIKRTVVVELLGALLVALLFLFAGLHFFISWRRGIHKRHLSLQRILLALGAHRIEQLRSVRFSLTLLLAFRFALLRRFDLLLADPYPF